MSWALLNGDLIKKENAMIPVDDRGFILGDGLFETMRAYDARPFRLSEHIDRLFRSCNEFRLRLPWTGDDISKMVSSLVWKNEAASARVRITVTRGKHTGSMSLNAPDSPTLLITAESLPPGFEERLGLGIKMKTVDVKFSESNPIFKHKTLNRMLHMLARTQAETDGCDEALILDEKGNVACASTGNVFVVQYGQLFTPPLTAPILPGVTRQVAIELARGEGVPIREDFFSPIITAGADEMFMTNSVQEIVPVVQVNEHIVGSGKPGPVTLKLLERYGELVRK